MRVGRQQFPLVGGTGPGFGSPSAGPAVQQRPSKHQRAAKAKLRTGRKRRRPPREVRTKTCQGCEILTSRAMPRRKQCEGVNDRNKAAMTQHTRWRPARLLPQEHRRERSIPCEPRRTRSGPWTCPAQPPGACTLKNIESLCGPANMFPHQVAHLNPLSGSPPLQHLPRGVVPALPAPNIHKASRWKVRGPT